MLNFFRALPLLAISLLTVAACVSDDNTITDPNENTVIIAGNITAINKAQYKQFGQAVGDPLTSSYLVLTSPDVSVTIGDPAGYDIDGDGAAVILVVRSDVSAELLEGTYPFDDALGPNDFPSFETFTIQSVAFEDSNLQSNTSDKSMSFQNGTLTVARNDDIYDIKVSGSVLDNNSGINLSLILNYEGEIKQ